MSHDAIIIGAGQAGSPLAGSLAGAGWKVALIEREFMGGTCVNVGCTPTKTMVASARVAHMARRAKDFGVETGPVVVNLEQVRRRKRAIVESFRQGSENRIQATEGIDLIRGRAGFTGPRSVKVELEGEPIRELSAEKIFINTGGRSLVPDIPGLSDLPFLDSTSIMELDSVPGHLLVLGGGYIGLEFGQMFHRFGSKVTVVQRSGQLLGREDPDIAGEVASILSDEGLDIMLETRPVRAAGGSDGIKLTVQTRTGEQTLEGSHLLVATGRAPNTDGLNLAAAGVDCNQRGFIEVNERLETNAPGIWAMGDVKGGPAFTHISYDDFRILRSNLLEGGNATTSGRQVPYTVFIDPQLGRIGLSETEARSKGLEIKVASMPMNWVARALEVDESRGLIKVVVDADSGRILGCAVLGLEGGEIMSILQMAMIGEVPYPIIRDTIFAHPTLAESLNNLFASLDD